MEADQGVTTSSIDVKTEKVKHGTTVAMETMQDVAGAEQGTNGEPEAAATITDEDEGEGEVAAVTSPFKDEGEDKGEVAAVTSPDKDEEEEFVDNNVALDTAEGTSPLRRRRASAVIEPPGSKVQPELSSALQQSFGSSGFHSSVLSNIDTTELINMAIDVQDDIDESNEFQKESRSVNESYVENRWAEGEPPDLSSSSLRVGNLEQLQVLARGLSAESGTAGAANDEDFMGSNTHVYAEGTSDHTGSEVLPHEAKKQPNIARAESKEVQRWLVGVVALLVIVCASVLTTVYIVLWDAQEREFLASFDQSASSISEASKTSSETILTSYETLADTITAWALQNDKNWPLVTVHDFETIAAHARINSATESVFLVPLVFGPQRGDWERYVANRTEWLEQSRSMAGTTEEWLEERGYLSTVGGLEDGAASTYVYDNIKLDSSVRIDQQTKIPTSITTLTTDTGTCWEKSDDTCILTTEGREILYGPIWQTSPPPTDPFVINYNLFSDVNLDHIISTLINLRERSMITGLIDAEFYHAGIWSPAIHSRFHQNESKDSIKDLLRVPHSFAITAIYPRLKDHSSQMVALLAAIVPWDSYFQKVLAEGVNGVHCVLESSCGEANTYEINGPTASFIGNADYHDPKYDYTRVSVDLGVLGSSSERSNGVEGSPSASCGKHIMLLVVELTELYADYVLKIYASDKYRDVFRTSEVFIFMTSLGIAFFLTGIVFCGYVRFVHLRQIKVMRRAIESTAIVESVFPEKVRQRMFESDCGNDELKPLTNDWTDIKSMPIADLYPECTIMIADLCGFTAWSSVREPIDVFRLLETIYGAFDKIARVRRIWKIETVGDQYVAGAGLPESRKDHALACCRFAHECRAALRTLVRTLETRFGADTGDLSIRVGVHSGPVVGGVLRGDRARFQVFGDTINTASRLESTCEPDKIQVSAETVSLLESNGKGHWARPRNDEVFAKGKGILKAYWLVIGAKKTLCSESGSNSSLGVPDWDPSMDLAENKRKRLIEWHVETLFRMLSKMEAQRHMEGVVEDDPTESDILNETSVIDEVCEIITLPVFKPELVENEITRSEKISLGDNVKAELRAYVTSIASMYNEANPFHCFEHVSHVAMSVTKLLSRIVAPKHLKESKPSAHSLHDHTYGITSDPLTQFACVFSALIHDVDHRGIPNADLNNEDPDLSDRYGGKSVAEQNSTDLAWNLLFQSQFSNLRKAIFRTKDELVRFRALVVNGVMATDLGDKGLKDLRNRRWEKAFNRTADDPDEDPTTSTNRKATIVIEHLIQASDVSHTMQHWHVYRKWNTRLFEEMYLAYKQGRSKTNPIEFWAKGEVGFFDFYIIPLAKKLKDCGVFGVSSFELLDYATRNRNEWAEKGEEIVQELVAGAEQKLAFAMSQIAEE